MRGRRRISLLSLFLSRPLLSYRPLYSLPVFFAEKPTLTFTLAHHSQTIPRPKMAAMRSSLDHALRNGAFRYDASDVVEKRPRAPQGRRAALLREAEAFSLFLSPSLWFCSLARVPLFPEIASMRLADSRVMARDVGRLLVIVRGND